MMALPMNENAVTDNLKNALVFFNNMYSIFMECAWLNDFYIVTC